MKTATWLGGIALGAVLLTGCGGSGEDPADTKPADSTEPVAKTFEAQVAVTAVNVLAVVDGALDDPPTDTPTCDEMPGKFTALHVGAEVTLLNAAGEPVATTKLETADPAPEDPSVCAWTGTFTGVPSSTDSGDAYTAKLGQWESEALSEAQLGSTRLLVAAE